VRPRVAGFLVAQLVGNLFFNRQGRRRCCFPRVTGTYLSLLSVVRMRACVTTYKTVSESRSSSHQTRLRYRAAQPRAGTLYISSSIVATGNLGCSGSIRILAVIKVTRPCLHITEMSPLTSTVVHRNSSSNTLQF